MTPRRTELAAIFAGGAAGALARVELTNLFPSADGRWPWAIFLINLSGAFILGYAVRLLQSRPALSRHWRPLVGTGFCGAFTTFSTLQLELLKMLDRDRYGLAAGYVAASVICGYGAVLVASALARRLRVAP